MGLHNSTSDNDFRHLNIALNWNGKWPQSAWIYVINKVLRLLSGLKCFWRELRVASGRGPFKINFRFGFQGKGWTCSKKLTGSNVSSGQTICTNLSSLSPSGVETIVCLQVSQIVFFPQGYRRAKLVSEVFTSKLSLPGWGKMLEIM